MYRSQQLALKYLTAAMVLFGLMVLFGVLSATYYAGVTLPFSRPLLPRGFFVH